MPCFSASTKASPFTSCAGNDRERLNKFITYNATMPPRGCSVQKRILLHASYGEEAKKPLGQKGTLKFKPPDLRQMSEIRNVTNEYDKIDCIVLATSSFGCENKIPNKKGTIGRTKQLN